MSKIVGDYPPHTLKLARGSPTGIHEGGNQVKKSLKVEEKGICIYLIAKSIKLASHMTPFASPKGFANRQSQCGRTDWFAGKWSHWPN